MATTGLGSRRIWICRSSTLSRPIPAWPRRRRRGSRRRPGSAGRRPSRRRRGPRRSARSRRRRGRRGPGEGVGQLEEGLGPEGVAHLGPADGDAWRSPRPPRSGCRRSCPSEPSPAAGSRRRSSSGSCGGPGDHSRAGRGVGHGGLRYRPMPELVALDLPGGAGFVDALRAVWDTGDAVGPARPPPARSRRRGACSRPCDPTRIVGPDGAITRLRGGRPVEDGDAAGRGHQRLDRDATRRGPHPRGGRRLGRGHQPAPRGGPGAPPLAGLPAPGPHRRPGGGHPGPAHRDPAGRPARLRRRRRSRGWAARGVPPTSRWWPPPCGVWTRRSSPPSSSGGRPRPRAWRPTW